MTYKLTSISQPADPYYGAVSLLLHGDGTNGSTTIVDNSPSPKTVTAVGNAQISTAQSKFGGSSLAFDGNGDYLTSASNIDFRFGSGDFTVESWVYLNRLTNPYGQIIAGTYRYSVADGDRGWGLDVNSTGKLNFYTCGSSGAADTVTATSALSIAQWYHVAVSRSGSTLRLFQDGVQVASTVSTKNEDYDRQLIVGSTDIDPFIPNIGNTGVSLSGYIDDLRITKGVARYTANFTPPTQPFISVNPRDSYYDSVSLLLKGDGANGSTTIVDNSPSPKTVTTVGNAQISTAQSKFGGSSLAFDGNVSYLTLNNVSSLRPGTTDYTLELWYYKTSNTNVGNTSNQTLFGTYWSGSSPTGAFVLLTNNEKIYFLTWNGVTLISTSDIQLQTWYHIAVVKSGTTYSLYINGINEASSTSSIVADNSTYPIVVGWYTDPNGYNGFFDGYIDELRVTKGVARYTSNFTPPGPHPTF